MSDLTYQDENEQNVFTSKFLKNRGTCCKTKCLHCPYGYTLNSLGLEFIPVTAENMKKANEIISPKKKEAQQISLGASMLASAFGPSKSEVAEPITQKNLDQYFIVKLKEKECGVIKKGITQLSKMYLKEHFTDQGLDIHIVDSLFNESK